MCSLKYPWGVIEVVLVRVDKFILPIGFIILDMEEDHEMSLILGRPFLATRKTLTDLHKWEITMRVNEGRVTFNIPKVMKHSTKYESCFTCDIVDNIVKITQEKETPQDLFQACLVKSTLEHEIVNE